MTPQDNQDPALSQANIAGVSQAARAEALALISAIARADAALDLEGFLALLAPDAILRIGSQPALNGIAAIGAAIAGLFAGMRAGIRHSVRRVWGDSETLVYQAEAAFPLKDGRDVTLPYVNVLDIGPGGRVGRYDIAIDLSAMELRDVTVIQPFPPAAGTQGPVKPQAS